MANQTDFKTFEEFWPHYLQHHSKPETRALHFAGTSVAAVGLAAWLVTRKKRYIALALLGSYGPAWYGHAAFEHNEPATLKYPIWSLRADIRMFQKWLLGELNEELSIAELKAKNTSSTFPSKSISRTSP